MGAEKIGEIRRGAAVDGDRKLAVILLKALAPKKSAAKSVYVASAAGQRVARLRQNERQLSITIDRRAAPDFADFLSIHLQEIFDSLAKPGVKPGG